MAGEAQEGPSALSDYAHRLQVAPVVYAVGAAVADDALRGGGADAGRSEELLARGGVDVQGEGV